MKKVFIFLIFLIILGAFLWQEIYLPKEPSLIEEQLFLGDEPSVHLRSAQEGFVGDEPSAHLHSAQESFVIEKNQSLFQISENLEREDLIKNKLYFTFYVLVKGKQKNLQAGEYHLSPSMAVPEIAEKIISGDTVKIIVTIPEGFTVKQIEKRIGLELPGENLEGFLFPDTYEFSLNITGEQALKTMQGNFERKISPYKDEISNTGKTLFEIITMASILEKEVKIFEEKKILSGIFWKRIDHKERLYSCATIAYILGRENWTFQEMRTEIALNRDIDSPYNTYKYLGLPPGPISNPGIESILAAMRPEDSDYWYYLSTPEGETIFSKTLEEHNKAKAKYF